MKYIEATPLVEGGDIIQSLRDRVLGRVAAEDIRDPLTGEIIVQANTEINEELAQKIEDSGLERVRIRSALTCESKRGICVHVLRPQPGHRAAWPSSGEAVGIIAAQSIGEPGTQLTMRTFHIGGTASRVVEASKHEAKNAGVVKYHNLRYRREPRRRHRGRSTATARSWWSTSGAARRSATRSCPAPRSRSRTSSGSRRGTLLVEWDPFTTPILTEVTGTRRVPRHRGRA